MNSLEEGTQPKCHTSHALRFLQYVPLDVPAVQNDRRCCPLAVVPNSVNEFQEIRSLVRNICNGTRRLKYKLDGQKPGKSRKGASPPEILPLTFFNDFESTLLLFREHFTASIIRNFNAYHRTFIPTKCVTL